MGHCLFDQETCGLVFKDLDFMYGVILGYWTWWIIDSEKRDSKVTLVYTLVVFNGALERGNWF